MTDFHHYFANVAGGTTVRELMRSWQLSKRMQGELRMTEGIKFNGIYLPMSATVPAGANVTLDYQAVVTVHPASTTPLIVVYEDSDVLIVNKPAGIKTHPNREDERDTMLNRAIGYIGGPAFITHRLDMATSGLLLFAKNPIAQSVLNQQLATKTMARAYTALVNPGLTGHGTIDQPIAHAPNDIRRRVVAANGLPAISFYNTLNATATASRVWLTLATGRTHQLRVHLQAIGHPIIGDPLYGTTTAPRMYLHATKIIYEQPFTHAKMTVHSEPEF